MSLIEEGDAKQVRMAHLSIVGSHSVNGVSALHSRLVQTKLVPDFYELWPERFNNKTNGVTPRRWLVQANPLLADLITRTIGDTWITDLDQLRSSWNRHANDSAFQQEFAPIKRANKERLARVIRRRRASTVDPASLFDVHVKRIHEYKRQLLNVMRIVHEYLCLVEDGAQPAVPRTYIFAGQGRAGLLGREADHQADLQCRFASSTAISRANRQMKVVFIPDFRVSLAEMIIPGADLSEQISTAGTEASGTGNMKFAMNGALTIGTLDGANIEMLEAVGAENMFIFGLTAERIQALRDDRELSTERSVQHDPRLKRILDAFDSTLFSPKEPGLFHWIVESILDHGDAYFHLADLPAYLDTQHQVDDAFKRPATWASKAILNVARIGRFSSDRTIREYARDIWGIAGV